MQKAKVRLSLFILLSLYFRIHNNIYTLRLYFTIKIAWFFHKLVLKKKKNPQSTKTSLYLIIMHVIRFYRNINDIWGARVTCRDFIYSFWFSLFTDLLRLRITLRMYDPEIPRIFRERAGNFRVHTILIACIGVCICVHLSLNKQNLWSGGSSIYRRLTFAMTKVIGLVRTDPGLIYEIMIISPANEPL